MNHLKTKLGKRIQSLRREQNITQEKFSEIIGLDITSLSKIETGRNYPSPDTLEKIARALNVEEQDLFNFNNFLSQTDYLKKIEENINIIKMDENKLRFLYKITKELI